MKCAYHCLGPSRMASVALTSMATPTTSATTRQNDFMNPVGFVTAQYDCMRVKRGGMTWWAPPCSLWVGICKHSTKRSPICPLGARPRTKKVIRHNRLVSRMCVMLEYCFERGIYFIIEQPRSSLMLKHPRLRRLLRKHGAKLVSNELGSLGAETLKPVLFYGTAPFMHKLEGRCTPEQRRKLKSSGHKTCFVYYNAKGKLSYNGRGKLLKDTQSYPSGLGCAVGLAYSEHRATCSNVTTFREKEHNTGT